MSDSELTPCSLCGKMMKLVLGTGDEVITIPIHQEVLTRSSEFFKKSVKPEWTVMRDEAECIDTTAHAPEVVKAYTYWLYTGKILARDIEPPHEGEDIHSIWRDLANAYVFGEEYMDDSYQRVILEAMTATFFETVEYPPVEIFTIVYNGTSEQDRARFLITALWGHGANNST